MKKLLLLLIVTTLIISACAKDDNTQAYLNKPYAGETINVYNWGDYIAEDTIELFTQETGIKVNYETFDSNEIMYSKLKSGAVDYDVLIPSDYMIEKLINEDMLLPLDKKIITNLSLIDDSYLDMAYDPGNTYSVPYFWGTVGILYNTDMVSEPVDSWGILWDETYKNQIIMQNSVRDSFAVALKYLGYSLNTSKQEEIDQAYDLLLDQKPLVQAYVIDEVKDKMIGNEAALAVIYSGEALFTSDENEALAYTVPKEGSNLWLDAMVVPAGSKHAEAAQVFINFMTSTEIAYNNTDYVGYSTPQKEVFEQLDDEIKNDQAAYPSKDILDNCEVFIDLGIEMTRYYDEKWTELKAQ